MIILIISSEVVLLHKWYKLTIQTKKNKIEKDSKKIGNTLL